MAIGLVAGRERLEDVEQYRKAMTPAEEVYLRFQQEVGHTLCPEIHKILYGRSFRLYIPEEGRAFHEAGGHSAKGCPSVCEKAARIAADVILRLQPR
jgi:hypothetical protein